MTQPYWGAKGLRFGWLNIQHMSRLYAKNFIPLKQQEACAILKTAWFSVHTSTHSFTSQHWHLLFVSNDLERLSFLCQRRFLYFFWFLICLNIMWLSHLYMTFTRQGRYFRLRQTDRRTEIVTPWVPEEAWKVLSIWWFVICWSHFKV